jgi:hypothetical protein
MFCRLKNRANPLEALWVAGRFWDADKAPVLELLTGGRQEKNIHGTRGDIDNWDSAGNFFLSRICWEVNKELIRAIDYRTSDDIWIHLLCTGIFLKEEFVFVSVHVCVFMHPCLLGSAECKGCAEIPQDLKCLQKKRKKWMIPFRPKRKHRWINNTFQEA